MAVALAAAPLAGCGFYEDAGQPGGKGATAAASSPPTNGIDKLAPAEIVARSRQAALAAPSVRIKADLTEKGERTKFDLRLKGAAGGRGVLYVDGQRIDLVRVRKAVYVKASTQFWKVNGAGRMSSVLGRKYVKAPVTDKEFAALAEFTDVTKVMNQFLAEDTGGSVGGRKGPEQAIRGQRALPVEDPGLDGWVVHIALDGKPYPLRLGPKAATPDLQGSLQFLDYDKPVAVEPPPASEILDLARAGTGSG